MTVGMMLVRMMILVKIMRSKMKQVNIAQLVDAWLRWFFLFR